MTRTAKTSLAALLLTACALLVAACGSEGVSVSSSDPVVHHGAELFAQRCAGCHTLDKAGTQGSAANIRTKERTDGPNFNVRPECLQQVLYAIRNGGFSGAIMPQNIVVGADAQAVAKFVSEYAGKQTRSSVRADAKPPPVAAGAVRQAVIAAAAPCSTSG